ncbi:MAG: hypothetical protein ACR2OE_04355 [Thermomicrobiales bacterium]
MSGYTLTSREDDPVHTVRTIARVAQMLIELRDEYTNRPREDTLQQIEKRLDDLNRLHGELKIKIAHQHEQE